MIKYIVEVTVDVEKQLNKIDSYTRKKRYTQIKGWDGKSPLYGTGKAYSTRLTPEIGMALQFSKEEDANHYAGQLAGDGFYQPCNPILSTRVLKVEASPTIIECVKEMKAKRYQ
jgi:hypothetical protein